MPNFAQTIIVGHLGQDPEIRFTQSGNAVANFSVAVTEKWKDQQGQPQEYTEWYRVVAWGKQAENYIGPYLKKGEVVMVRGKMKTRKWQDQQGNDRYSTELEADRFGGVTGMGGKKGNGGGQQASAGSAEKQQPAQQGGDGGKTQDWEEKDLPF